MCGRDSKDVRNDRLYRERRRNAHKTKAKRNLSFVISDELNGRNDKHGVRRKPLELVGEGGGRDDGYGLTVTSNNVYGKFSSQVH